MADRGVPTVWVRPLVLGRLSGGMPAATGLLGAGLRFIGGRAREGILDADGAGRGGSGSRSEDLIAQAAQGVVAAPGQLAGDGQQRELPVEAVVDLQEVGMVG